MLYMYVPTCSGDLLIRLRVIVWYSMLSLACILWSADTTELQQNGIAEEVEPTTVTTPQPATSASQDYVYEPTVDHVASEPEHSEGVLESEQFTPTEPETKSKREFLLLILRFFERSLVSVVNAIDNLMTC